jgi:hypothetical protein
VLREAVVELPNAASDHSCEADSGGLIVETGLKTEKLSSTLSHPSYAESGSLLCGVVEIMHRYRSDVPSSHSQRTQLGLSRSMGRHLMVPQTIRLLESENCCHKCARWTHWSPLTM